MKISFEKMFYAFCLLGILIYISIAVQIRYRSPSVHEIKFTIETPYDMPIITKQKDILIPLSENEGALIVSINKFK